MGLSYDYDCASSILLCAEDNSILSFDDEDEVGHGQGEAHEPRSSGFNGDPFMGSFPLQSDECMDLLVEREVDHLPIIGYVERLQTRALDPSIRRDAIDWMLKAHSYYSFGPLSAYLSVNYLDRFLSVYELPAGKAWMTQLLSVACLSLAAKMEEVQVPLSLDLQIGETKYVFESKTIQRMELLVLSTLKWRLQAVTPFAYIDYFLDKFSDGSYPTMALIHRSEELIISLIKGIDFLSFRPSEISAAVVLTILGETQMAKIEKLITGCNHVDKGRVLSCFEVVQEVALMVQEVALTRNRPLMTATPSLSPNGVLGVACLSYKSEGLTVSLHANSYPSSPPMKRRKICRGYIS